MNEPDPLWVERQPEGPGPWHVIHGDTLRAMLRRCAEGEDPDMVYIEEYVNAEGHEEGDAN